MKVKKKDKFLSNILGYPSYNINSKNEINHFNKINNNFLLVLKITNHLSAKDCKNFDIKMRSKLITFKKEILNNRKLYSLTKSSIPATYILNPEGLKSILLASVSVSLAPPSKEAVAILKPSDKVY